MVTLITDKLRQQTLKEISSNAKAIQSEQLRKASEEREAFDIIRNKSSKGTHQHRRSHTARNYSKVDSFGQDGPERRRMAGSSSTPRCHSYPPARKRICRSLSDPNQDQERKPSWNPEPSSIWTPVKPQKVDRGIGKPAGARSLEFTINRDTFSWSTPPESPIPRPASANSALEDSKFFPLRLISEESHNRTCFSSLCLGKSSQPKQCSSLCSSLPRSHSHPSFSNIVNNTLKRRLSEVDIPRPALDFDKMKARCFANPNLQKRTVKSPKYSSKSHSSTSPKAPKCEKSSLSPNVSVDFGSSLMITPTASPTNIGNLETLEVEKWIQREDENANTTLGTFTDHECFRYETLQVNTDLDIKLIEEDGSLNDSEIHNPMFFTKHHI